MVLLKLSKRGLVASWLGYQANAADMTNESHMTMNSVDYGKVEVGSEVPVTSSGQPPPIDNSKTVLDESTFSVNLSYATVYNEVVELDYFYFFIDFAMEKPVDYPNFTVMLYAQVITSDDDPIKHQTTEPTIETCSMTTPFFGEDFIE